VAFRLVPLTVAYDRRRAEDLTGGAAAAGRVVRPQRVIILRHGESMGNVDFGTYVVVPDWRVPLTRHGQLQAKDAGARIKE
jgi:hypothetical protein